MSPREYGVWMIRFTGLWEGITIVAARDAAQAWRFTRNEFPRIRKVHQRKLRLTWTRQEPGVMVEWATQVQEARP
ncbi:MAG: hypothetical protein GWO24_31055 [Akkermansiaceae bacterium]|nr:hypothetical protein [Akkermansiaceae bacterium]NIS11202.1 hypothetical protein [Thermoplasmata archaeon]NIS19140.1 hypothetical protein [Thermoplasmata archaeon]NIT76196.1 hypothetical protein [Thermoplasmata archaeon]NIY02567.1 hypothetical protein [Thermoplasmata archaeon]